MQKIKTGDKVIILTGKDKGKSGKVIQVFTATNKIVVEGANILKKHIKSRKQGQKGQVIELSAPFASANAMLYCERCARGVRSGIRAEADKKIRYCKKCKEAI